MGLTAAELAQLDSFRDYLQLITDDSEEAANEKRAQDEKMQRETMQRQNKLHNTLFETLSNENDLQRKDELDAIDRKKQLANEDLRRIDDAKMQDRQSTEERHGNREQSQYVALSGFAPTDAVKNAAETMQGLAREAVDSAATSATHIETTSLRSLSESVTITPGENVAKNHAEQSRQVNAVTENPQELAATVSGNRQEQTTSIPRTISPEKPTPLPSETTAEKVENPGESSKEMQMLASFSGVSSRLARTLRGYGDVKSFSEAKLDGSKTETGFASLFEFGDEKAASDSHAAKKAPLEAVEQRDSSFQETDTESEPEMKKSVPSFLTALNQVLTPRTHRHSANTPIMEAVQRNASQHASAAVPQSLRPTSEMKSSETEEQVEESAETAQTQGESPDSLFGDAAARTRFLHRIVGACLSAVNQNGSIRMKLHPEALGALTLHVQLREEEMDLFFEVETEEAASILEEHFELLRERLESQGYRIASHEITLHAV